MITKKTLKCFNQEIEIFFGIKEMYEIERTINPDDTITISSMFYVAQVGTKIGPDKLATLLNEYPQHLAVIFDYYMHCRSKFMHSEQDKNLSALQKILKDIEQV